MPSHTAVTRAVTAGSGWSAARCAARIAERCLAIVPVRIPAWAHATRYPDTVAGAAGIGSRSWRRQNAVNAVHTER